MGQANGLASQITGPHTSGLLPMGHIKALIYTSPVDSVEHLTARIEAAATIRQEFGIFGRARLCCVVGCVSRMVAVHSNICSKLL